VTAVETWPDGRPKRVTNLAAWNGERPLVEPQRVPIQVGCVVWEKTPGQVQAERDTGEEAADDGDHTLDRRGGLVVKIVTDPATGERTVTVLEGRKRNRVFEVVTRDLDASEIDGSTVEARSQHRMHRAVLQICRALGENQNGFVAGYRRYLFELAVGLLVVADEDAAALKAERDAHEAARVAAGETSDWEANRG
jgi:hypothetical protein